jgi:polar amino acid transport system substrate-binding protein
MLYKISIFILCLLYSTTILAQNFIINTQEWPPYQYQKGNQLEGSATKVVKCILKNLKIKYQINVLPWRRAQEEVKLGYAQAFYSAGVTDERNSYAVPTNKIASYKWYWYLKNNSSFNPNSEEFKKKAEVAAKFGTALETYLIEKKFNLVSSPKDISNLFDMLEAERFDAFLSPEEPAIEEMKNRNWNKNKFKVVFHSENPLVFYFSKKFVLNNNKIVNQFNSFIEKCTI